MDEDIRVLENIKFQCEEILKSLKRHKLSPEVLSDDIIFYNGCCGTIFEIGEQAKHLSKEYCRQHPDVKWKYIVQNRDKIGHHYGDLNVKIIWDTINIDIPILLKHCIAGIEELKAKNN